MFPKVSINESVRIFPPNKKFSTSILRDVMTANGLTDKQWQELKLRLWDTTGKKTELYELEQKLDAICSKTLKGKIIAGVENALVEKTKNKKETELVEESGGMKYLDKDGIEVSVGDKVSIYGKNSLGGYTVIGKLENGKIRYQIGEKIDTIMPSEVWVTKKFVGEDSSISKGKIYEIDGEKYKLDSFGGEHNGIENVTLINVDSGKKYSVNKECLYQNSFNNFSKTLVESKKENVTEIRYNSRWKTTKDISFAINSHSRNIIGNNIVIPKGTEIKWDDDSNDGASFYYVMLNGVKERIKIWCSITSLVADGRIELIDNGNGTVAYKGEYLQKRLGNNKANESEQPNKFLSQYKNQTVENLNKEKEKIGKELDAFTKKTNPTQQDIDKNAENTERLGAINELMGAGTENVDESTTIIYNLKDLLNSLDGDDKEDLYSIIGNNWAEFYDKNWSDEEIVEELSFFYPEMEEEIIDEYVASKDGEKIEEKINTSESSDKEWYNLRLAMRKASKDSSSGVGRLFGTSTIWGTFTFNDSPWCMSYNGSGDPSMYIETANNFLSSLGYEMVDAGNRSIKIEKLDKDIVAESSGDDMEKYYRLAKEAHKQNKIKDLSPSYDKTKGFKFYHTEDECNVEIYYDELSSCIVMKQNYENGNPPEDDDISTDGFAKYLGIQNKESMTESNNRIQKMVDSWKKDGVSYSHIDSDDAEFFKQIGVDSGKVGSTSQTGLDVVYYDTKLYDSDTDALRRKKKTNESDESDYNDYLAIESECFKKSQISTVNWLKKKASPALYDMISGYLFDKWKKASTENKTSWEWLEMKIDHDDMINKAQTKDLDETKSSDLKIGDKVTFTHRNSKKTFTGKYIEDYKNGWIIVDCGNDGKVATLPGDCTVVKDGDNKVLESGKQMTLSELEDHINSNISDIEKNMAYYGYDSAKQLAAIDNYYDLANVLGVDSRLLKTVEIEQYARTTSDLVGQGGDGDMDESNDFYANSGVNSKALGITDDIGTFWVITKPKGKSTLNDIFFEADIMYMMNQFRGGLKDSEIVGFYSDETRGKVIAENLVANQLVESKNGKAFWDDLPKSSQNYLVENTKRIGDSYIVDGADGRPINATAISESRDGFNFKLEKIK